MVEVNDLTIYFNFLRALHLEAYIQCSEYLGMSPRLSRLEDHFENHKS